MSNQISIGGLILFIKNQPFTRYTSTALWDPCVIADYIREAHHVEVPRLSNHKALEPFLKQLREEPVYGAKIVQILSNPSMPDVYGDLLTYIVAEFPRAAELIQTKALV